MEEPTPKRRRHSLQGDVDVEVEGQIVQVRSYVLMSASEVFANMLQSDMQEASTGRIVLHDKTLEGFKEVLEHLDLRGGAAPPDITLDNVELLLQYADEYHMLGLKSRCERFLIETCSDQNAEYVLSISDMYNMTLAKRTATRKLAQVVGGPLRKYEADYTVRQTVYQELLEAVGMLSATVTLDSDDENAGSQSATASEHWKAILQALAELKKTPRSRPDSIFGLGLFSGSSSPPSDLAPRIKKIVHLYLEDFEKDHTSTAGAPSLDSVLASCLVD